MATGLTIDDDLPRPDAPQPSQTAAPVVIEVQSLDKTFRVPEQRIDSLKERAVHPLRRIHYRTLRALQGVDFEVRRGEFFGIVGRNGSGKSTLLKIMASIYRADAGRVRIAGRLAPFIELGVGFNPDLTARENAILNGVLMGLGRREAARRVDAVIDFAELHDFRELKLKNYSSGMMVRLAFAVMVQADADIMLIDEVLAVGDAAFAQKCMDVFYERRRLGKTVVLVTHDMATVESLCHRAMLLHDGAMQYIGEPSDAALRYYRLNFAGPVPEASAATEGGEDWEAVRDLNVRLVRASVRDDTGQTLDGVEQGQPIRFDILLTAAREMGQPSFTFNLLNASGVVVAEWGAEAQEPVPTGGHIRLRGWIENRLVADRYYLDCWVGDAQQRSSLALQALRVLTFVVYGTAARHGLVTLRAEIEPTVEGSFPDDE